MSAKRKKNFDQQYKVDLPHNEGKKALKKITGYDRTLQQRTLESVKKRDDLIIHIRENQYSNRKVVQA